jgi:DNA replication and repair protein RecF
MHLTRLSLTNVRTYRKLELEPGRGIHVIAGENAAGKSNLLDAIAMLATTRSHHAGNDLDLISWSAIEQDPLPAARITADVSGAAGAVSLEIAIIAGEPNAGGVRRTSRRFRLNGVARRASDLIGQLRVVMFSADDLTIISGSPSGRRRYLDLTISQFDPAYVRASQLYNRVLQQRNSLLRRLQERRGQLDELAFWDDELSGAGAIIIQARQRALERLGTDAAARYPELGSEGETLEICYRPALPDELQSSISSHDFEERFRQAIEEGRQQDVYRGATRFGPHRDDVAFLISGHDASVSASRGQQRTAALALRLSEIALSTDTTGDPPVLLLDDIFSELDAHHRDRIMHTVYAVDQVFITTPDNDRPSRSELPEANRYLLEHGELGPL